MTGPGGARILDAVRVGIRALLRRPLRTFLVLQGVVWGVAVAIVPSAVLEGSHRAAEERAEALGTDRISIRAQPAAPEPWLLLEDLDAVRERFGPVLASSAGYRSKPTDVGGIALDRIGGVGDVLAARGQTIARGRPLRPDEIERGDPVALLEPEAARALFGEENPIDREVRLGADESEVVRVVGVVAPRSQTALDTDDLGLDRTHPFSDWLRQAMSFWGLAPGDDDWKRAERGVIVPLSRVASDRPDSIEWMILRADVNEVPAESLEIERFLAERGRDVEVSINLVWPILAGHHVDRYLALNKALFLACLVMSGVVIANLMLLSVLERYREIAIRRAEGATRGDIVLQFLTEAFLMGVIGAVLGVPLGLGLARLRVALEPVTMIVVVVPWKAIAITVSAAVVTAVVAGILPAVRAARLDPVEALRCE